MTQQRIAFLAIVAGSLIGCSGDPAPTLGDAEIAKGMERPKLDLTDRSGQNVAQPHTLKPGELSRLIEQKKKERGR